MITDFTKQSELIDVNKFDIPIHVIGCGALGSWLTFFLLKMGFKNVTIYDFDEIEEHNLPNQMFAEEHIGKQKVEALKMTYESYFDDIKERLTVVNERVVPKMAKEFEGIVFSCVDSMSVRRKLYEACVKEGKADLWIEGRIGLFGAYIYTLNYNTPKMCEAYEATLYEDEEAEVSACGVSQTALPAAVCCASNMLMQMISWYRGNDIYNSITFQIPDMLSFTKRW